jgi:hypothetical protein
MVSEKALPRELLFVCTAVLALHWLTNLGDGFLIGTFDDDGVYTVLGKAIAEGRGYLSLHLVGTPVQVKYPPGFPVILSVLWDLTGSVEGVQAAVRWVHPIVVALTAALLWGLARLLWKLDWSLTALFVIAPLVLDAAVQYAQIPLAEPWFMLGWATVLVAWEWAGAGEGLARYLRLVLVGMAVAGTTLVRSQGIVLIIGVVAGLRGRRHHWREAAALGAAMALPLLAWQLYHRSIIAVGPLADLPDEGTYAGWFAGSGAGLAGTVFQSVLSNIRFYIHQIGAYLTAFDGIGSGAMALLLLGMVGAGVHQMTRRPLLATSVLASLVLVFLWPFAQDRLLLSTLPFGGLLAVAALQVVITRAPAPVRRWIPVAAVAAFVVILLRQMDIRRDSLAAAIADRPPALLSPAYGLLVNSRFIATASHWVRINTRPGDRIMIDHQSGLYLYTGRQTMPASPSESRFVPSVFTSPGRYLAGHILRDSLTYLIIGLRKPGIMRDVEAISARCPGVLTWGGVSAEDSRFIYRIRPDSSCLQTFVAP